VKVIDETNLLRNLTSLFSLSALAKDSKPRFQTSDRSYSISPLPSRPTPASPTKNPKAAFINMAQF
jgi:hypothetical protein